VTQATTTEAFGSLGEDATLTLERMLPGSIDRVWAYLTESDLRRQWLAAGTMEMRVGRAGLAQPRVDQESGPAAGGVWR
jgi:uncharacterized protein YndB with AHSA1/START domain